MIIEKIEPSILNGLGYIVHLEKKNGNKKYCEQYFLCFSSFLKRQIRAVEMTKTLLQRNKKDATEYNASKNIVGDIFAIITIYQGAKHRSINR